MLRTTLTAAALSVPVALSAGAAKAADDDTLIVGSTNFTEQLILANMYQDVLEDEGVDVKTRLNLGSREVVFPALRNDEIEALPEYTGALLAHVSEGKKVDARKPQAVIDRLKKALPSSIRMLQPSSAQDKDALVVRPETAKKHNLKTFSDLAEVSDKLIVGGPPEMKTRRVGLPGLKDVYGMNFKAFRSLDAGGPLTKNALKNGDIDVARMFSTQGAIQQNGWVRLEDDKNLTPAQNLIPVIRKDAVNDTIRKALNELSAALTTDALTKLNAKVGVKNMDPSAVAEAWVKKQGLIDGME